MIAAIPSLPFLLPASFEEDSTNFAGATSGDLFEGDKKDYMGWLDKKPPGSVVYVAFRSMKAMQRRQIEEIIKGLSACKNPYSLVLTKDNGDEVGDVEMIMDVEGGGRGEAGMVMEWCDQGKVLRHPTVGCFMTHCGWNSMMESLATGARVVGLPGCSDQPTNAWLAE